LITGDHTEPTWLDARDRFVTERVFTLEPMLAGEQVIPALRFDLGSAAGEPDQILTQPIAITVTTLLPGGATDAEATAQAELGSIRDIVEPTSSTPFWLLALLTLVVIGGGGLAIILLRRSRRRPRPEPAADQVALAALDELLGSAVLQAQQWDIFFAELSLILRRFLEARFDLQAPQRSTEEFLREARGAAVFQPDQVGRLDHFLHRADLVKFAAAEVHESEAREAADQVRDFVLKASSQRSHGEDA
ncbi:MAG: hypothetical protein ACF8NJ_04125, partial [Phycisphaerales bacterium JB038]